MRALRGPKTLEIHMVGLQVVATLSKCLGECKALPKNAGQAALTALRASDVASPEDEVLGVGVTQDATGCGWMPTGLTTAVGEVVVPVCRH